MRIVVILIGLIVGVGAGVLWNQRPEPPKLVRGVAQHVTNAPEQEEMLLPKQVRIPKIAVSADIEYVGLDEKGHMDVPKDADNTAWFELGFKPGSRGNAVLAGHFDHATGAPAVFYNLSSLQKGDEIEVEDEEGRVLTFVVTRLETYQYDSFPLQEVFGPSSGKNLNLITCEGSFDKSAKNYSHRTVVYSELKE